MSQSGDGDQEGGEALMLCPVGHFHGWEPASCHKAEKYKAVTLWWGEGKQNAPVPPA